MYKQWVRPHPTPSLSISAEGSRVALATVVTVLDGWKQRGDKASERGRANRAFIHTEFIVVVQVSYVLKWIIMTMPLSNSTRISSVPLFKRA